MAGLAFAVRLTVLAVGSRPKSFIGIYRNKPLSIFELPECSRKTCEKFVSFAVNVIPDVIVQPSVIARRRFVPTKQSPPCKLEIASPPAAARNDT